MCMTLGVSLFVCMTLCGVKLRGVHDTVDQNSAMHMTLRDANKHNFPLYTVSAWCMTPLTIYGVHDITNYLWCA